MIPLLAEDKFLKKFFPILFQKKLAF